MRWFAALIVAMMTVQAAEVVAVGDKFKDSGKCKACHSHIVKQWDTSWHANSHYDNDEYLRKSIDYVARKMSGKSLNSIKIECAACHNPRISVTSTSSEYDAIAIMKLDANTAVNKALNSDTISEGINCVVCHNIDQIHDDLPENKRGIHRVSWMPSGDMSGPYADAKSPYHKVEQRSFMDSNPNQLCFVCHANDTSEEGLRFTNMQSEFKGSKQCVDCHMSPRKSGVAATLRTADGKPMQRLIREHGFKGGHVESMWKGALNVQATKNATTLDVTLVNPQPHALPSGFGAREIVVMVEYQNGGKTIKTEQTSITSKYFSKRGKPTIPHVGAKFSEQDAVPAQGSKTYSFPLAPGAQNAVITVYYRLVNDEVREMLDLKEAIWSKKMLIQKINQKL